MPQKIHRTTNCFDDTGHVRELVVDAVPFSVAARPAHRAQNPSLLNAARPPSFPKTTTEGQWGSSRSRVP